MIQETDVVSIFGMRRCGKSTLTRTLSSLFPRRVVFDRLREWRDASFTVVQTIPDFNRAWEHLHSHDAFTLVVQFAPGLDQDSFSTLFNHCMKLVYETGFRKRQAGIDDSTLVVFEELQFYCTPHYLEPYLSEAVFTGRHAGLTLIGNTQRPASVHKGFVAQSAHLFVGQLQEPRDIMYLRDSPMGDEVFKARSLRQGDFLWQEYGSPTRLVRG